MYEDFLQLVEKPARYINNEINSVRKDPDRIKTRVCLFFPDTYEVGMSHIGLRILYDILNSREDTACERVFAPWTDYEDRLRASGRPLKSLETNTPLMDFDIIGVTLQYELSYSNILTCLDLSGIPLRSEARKDNHPIVVAGGPCSVNPEPLSDFIDVFFIGEAEDAVHEIIELRQIHADRWSYLEALARKEGFYVPILGKKAVKRRFQKGIETAPFPLRPILPLFKPIHDRVNVEIARGCIRGCRFCQAGIIYRPYRERSPETIKSLIDESLRCTGYEEVSLSSLSAGDYSGIQPLISGLINQYKDSRVSISLPSLRIGTLTPEMVFAVANSRKTGFTLAPEAGTERLRNVINKPLGDLDLIDIAETIFKSGWNTIKLYFMIGLPTETTDDLKGIARLVKELFAVGRRTSRRHIQLNISISTFVPKPHTPFQWIGQIPLKEIRDRQMFLESILKRRGVNLKFHRAEMSLLEAAFARGERSMGMVLERAFRLGCRFDGWNESFDFGKWRRAFNETEIDAEGFASRNYGLEDPLPWDFVNVGVTKAFLKKEYQKALAGEITENCRVACEGCGIGCKAGGTAELGRPESIAAEQVWDKPLERVPKAKDQDELAVRIRLKYSKTGRIRFLSHLDMITMFRRAIMRASIPVLFSHGYNPHPRISFGPPLSVGIESMAEYLDIEADPPIDLMEAVKAINRALPDGIRVIEAKIVPRKLLSLTGSIKRIVYRISIPDGFTQGLSERIDELLSRTSIIIEKEGKKRDIRAAVESIVLSGEERPHIDITLHESGGVHARVQDVIEQLFGITTEKSALLSITRIGQFVLVGEKWIDPMEQV